MTNPAAELQRLHYALAEGAEKWRDFIEQLQGPERGAMRFMWEAYRAIDETRGFALAEKDLHALVIVTELAFPETLLRDQRWIESGRLYDALITLPTTATELLARDYDVPMKVVAEWLDTSAKTLSRREKISLLSRAEADVASRYGRVFEQAKEAFGSDDAAREWLTQEQPALKGAVPVELLRSDLGARQVERVLRLIDYGDYL